MMHEEDGIESSYDWLADMTARTADKPLRSSVMMSNGDCRR